MKRKFLTLFLAAYIVGSGINVFATNDIISGVVYPNADETNVIKSSDGKISAEIDISADCISGRRIAWVVLKPGVSAKSFTDSENTEDVAALGTISTDESKKATIEIVLTGLENGTYTLLCGQDRSGENNYYVSEFRYANPTNIPSDLRAVIEKVNEYIENKDLSALQQYLKDSEAMEQLLTDATRILDFNDTQLKQCASAIYQHGKFQEQDVLYYDDIYVLSQFLEEQIAYAAISCENSVEKIKEAITYYNDKYYNFDIKGEIYRSNADVVVEYMKNRTVTTKEEATQIFSYAVLKTQIGNTIYQKIYNLIIDNVGLFPSLSEKTLKSKVSDINTFGQYIKKNIGSCNTVEELESKIIAYKESSSGSSSSSGGGGSSGGGSGKSSASILTPESSAQTDSSVVLQTYSDVDAEHWAYDGVEALSALNVVTGYEDGTFKPDNNVSRAEFIKMLICAFHKEWLEEENECTFDDVDINTWYYPYLAAAQTNAMIVGNAGMGEPNNILTREEMAVMVYNVCGEKVKQKKSPEMFSDESEISDWAISAVIKLRRAEIVNGVGNGAFEPKSPVTRAQAGVIIYNTICSMAEVAK